MKPWISIGEFIINPEYFNMFYVEEITLNEATEWHIFGEDKSQICWRLMDCPSKSLAYAWMQQLRIELNIDKLNK
jgi:hypothetical protein